MRLLIILLIATVSAFAQGSGPRGATGAKGSTGPQGPSNIICAGTGTTTVTCPGIPAPASYGTSGTGYIAGVFTPASGSTAATTLNINSLGAAAVLLNGSAISTGSQALIAGTAYPFQYDGTSFRLSSGNANGTFTPSLSCVGTNVSGQIKGCLAKVASQLTAALPRTNITAIPAGDSITAGSNTLRTGVPDYLVSSDYIGYPLMTSGGRFNYLRNAGVAGNTCQQLLTRLQVDVISYAPNVVPVLIGTNNLTLIAGGATYASLMNCVENIVANLLNAGILPILVTPPPNNANPLVAKRLQWFYYQLAQYYSIPLLDVYKVWVDPSASSGNGGKYLSSFSGDGTHPNIAAINAAAPYIQSFLSALSQPQDYAYMGSVSESTAAEISNLVKNGNFAVQTTPPSPDFWVLNNTSCVYTSATAVYPYVGSSLTCTVAAPGGAYSLYSGTGPSVPGTVPKGDTVYVSVHVKVTGLTPASASGFSICDGPNGCGGDDFVYKSVFNGDYNIFSTFVVPTDYTSILSTAFLADTGVYAYNNWTIVDVTAENAIWQAGQQGY